MADAIADSIIRRQSDAASRRGTWEEHWQEASELVLPRYSNSFTQPGYATTPGEKRTEKMFDATAALGLERFAAAMESMLTPRNGKWHLLKADDDNLNKDRRVALWFEEVNRLLFKYRYSPRANYASNQHEGYLQLGAFGTGGLFVDELDGGGLRYKAIPLGDVYFLENHQGIIDTAFRKLRLSARQALQKWGAERLPEKIVSAAEKRPEEEVEFIHAVMPREDLDPTRLDYKGMPFASYYVACESKYLISESGYNTFPYPISRYVTAPGEVYGRSPAMLVLANIKVLNQQQKTMLKHSHRSVDPVLLIHDDGMLDSLSLKPGAMNYGGMTAEGRSLVGTIPVGNPATTIDMMDRERATINDAFLVTLFQILVDTPRMTATEVLERAREKGALLSPTMGRQQSELLAVTIERELDLLARQGMLPPMPEPLVEAEGEYKIEYDSPLSRAQKAEEASGLIRTVEAALNYVQVTQDPEPLDHFNWDEIVPALADINAVPIKWRNSAEQIKALRDQRRAQMDRREMVEAAPAAAGLMKAAQ